MILFLLGYGQISSNLFPLRWSNAFFSVDKNISILALNPIQNLFDTVNAARGTRPDIEATRESYPRVAAWLRVPNPDPQKLDFMRTVPGTPAERGWVRGAMPRRGGSFPGWLRCPGGSPAPR